VEVTERTKGHYDVQEIQFSVRSTDGARSASWLSATAARGQLLPARRAPVPCATLTTQLLSSKSLSAIGWATKPRTPGTTARFAKSEAPLLTLPRLAYPLAWLRRFTQVRTFRGVATGRLVVRRPGWVQGFSNSFSRQLGGQRQNSLLARWAQPLVGIGPLLLGGLSF
jgi:hypothetical protein